MKEIDGMATFSLKNKKQGLIFCHSFDGVKIFLVGQKILSSEVIQNSET